MATVLQYIQTSLESALYMLLIVLIFPIFQRNRASLGRLLPLPALVHLLFGLLLLPMLANVPSDFGFYTAFLAFFIVASFLMFRIKIFSVVTALAALGCAAIIGLTNLPDLFSYLTDGFFGILSSLCAVLSFVFYILAIFTALRNLSGKKPES